MAIHGTMARCLDHVHGLRLLRFKQLAFVIPGCAERRRPRCAIAHLRNHSATSNTGETDSGLALTRARNDKNY
jgi:hypothetical protein